MSPDAKVRPTVVGVHVSRKHAFSKAPQPVIRLIENFGVEGDAHAGPTNRHRYHVKRFGLHPNLRQVHLIQAELFDEVGEKGHVVAPGDLGENVSTRGVDLLELPTGTRLRLGPDAVIELTGLRNPCSQIEDWQPGLLKHVAVARPTGLVRKAGVMSIVLAGGEVRPGDAIAIELPPLPHEPLIYRVPEIEVLVTSIRREAEGIHSVELRALEKGALPFFTAGAHIDLRLGAGLTRSYSLSNDPDERGRYVVSVNKDASSRGGSLHVHERLRVSDRLVISPPRNNFPLDEDAGHSVLIAGGIGITPLRSMIARLEHMGRSWTLFYATRARGSTAFLEELQALEARKPGRVHLHIRAEAGGKRMDLGAVVSGAPAGAHVYCCGPHSMMEAFEAATAAVPQARVHAERFGARSEAATEGGFKLVLRRSGREVAVVPGASMLDALLAVGIDVPHSCREGVCGSCKVRVIEGMPDHRDSVLDPDERSRNEQVTVCCSGSRTPVLVLDL